MQGAKFVENGEWRGKFFAWGRGGLLFHRMYKKTPEGVFYRMFLDVITGDTLAGKAFYAKK